MMSPKELASANIVLLVSLHEIDVFLASHFSVLIRVPLLSQITSVFNVAVSVLLQEYIGALGLVVANCFAMSIRIAYTLCYSFRSIRGDI